MISTTGVLLSIRHKNISDDKLCREIVILATACHLNRSVAVFNFAITMRIFRENICKEIWWCKFFIPQYRWDVITYPCHVYLEAETKGTRFRRRHFRNIFLNKNDSISTTTSLKFVPKGPINNIPALVQIMAWRRPRDKLLSEPMMVSLLTHICVTRPQWV